VRARSISGVGCDAAGGAFQSSAQQRSLRSPLRQGQGDDGSVDAGMGGVAVTSGYYRSCRVRPTPAVGGAKGLRRVAKGGPTATNVAWPQHRAKI
jgi:hypothetical protein